MDRLCAVPALLQFASAAAGVHSDQYAGYLPLFLSVDAIFFIPYNFLYHRHIMMAETLLLPQSQTPPPTSRHKTLTASSLSPLATKHLACQYL